MNEVLRVAQGDSKETVGQALADAADLLGTGSETVREKRRALLEEIACFYEVDADFSRVESSNPAQAKGVSVVTCSRNRNENLIKALPSWLACKEVSEIIIVDWTSERRVDDDLMEAGVEDARIRVIRVEGEARWILSHPFNLGFQNARFDKILKADADIVLDPAFFRRNALLPGQFIAGNWRTAASGQAHVNGFFYVWRNVLQEIGGFNEYITTYGWDDDELYSRLQEVGLSRVDVARDTILHLDHDDAARTEKAAPHDEAPAAQTLPTQTQYLIRRNRQLAHLMPAWSSQRPRVLYDVLEERDGLTVVQRQAGSGQEPSETILREASLAAARELLAWRHGDICYALDHARVERLLDVLPWEGIDAADVVAMLASPVADLTAERRWLFVGKDVCDSAQLEHVGKLAAEKGLTLILIGEGSAVGTWPELPAFAPVPAFEALSIDQLEATGKLKAKAYSLKGPAASRRRSRGPHISVPKAKVFVDGQHGLGNRLRAIGSGAAIAQATDRELVIVWEPDDHCDCRFRDLFDYHGAVEEEAFAQSAAKAGARVYNYMEIEEGAEKDAPVELESGQDVYLRSAYVLKHPASSWEAENDFLKALRPVDSVLELIDSVRWPNDLSAHIRMVGGKQFEHLPWEAADNWTDEGHDLVDHWRTKSHYSNFIKRIDDLIAAGDIETMFIAADMPETYEVFQERYGDRVAFLTRTVNDRSAEQLKYAFADATLLSRAPRMLGSTWSSFSELAQRLAHPPMQVEMSGTDF